MLSFRFVHLRFDRGTILITDVPEHLDLAAGAPGVLWDSRVQAHRAPAAAYARLHAWLLGAGARVVDAVRTERQATDGWTEIDLRAYQATALWAWELAGRRGVVVLPTGSGKTRVALAAMAQTRLPALCLVPTRVLLDQWRREIASVYPHAVGAYGDGTRDAAPVTVATYESAYRHMDRLGHRFDLLVIDEVHHFGCGLRDEALEMSLASARLGLTATPPRNPAHLAAVAELVGPTVYELTIGDLTGRYLADFDTITVHLDLNRAERATYARLSALFIAVYAEFRRRLPQGTWPDFARTAAHTHEGRHALSAWREARRLLAFTEAKRGALEVLLGRHREARVLVFTADNETAYAIARDHLVMPLTCDIGRDEREQALERFRRGDLRVLVSARVLNEGLDVPDADVAVVVGAAFGEREHIQRVGRLLRPGPGKRALVYELVTRQTIEVGQARRRREGLGLRSTP